MAIQVACDCGKLLKASASLAGKRGKCPYCGAGVSIPILKASPAAPASEGLSAAVQLVRSHRKPSKVAAKDEIVIDLQPERLAPLVSRLVVGGTTAAALLVGVVTGVCGTLVWQSWFRASTIATASNVAGAGHERAVSENRGAPESDRPKIDPAARERKQAPMPEAAPASPASAASGQTDSPQTNAGGAESERKKGATEPELRPGKNDAHRPDPNAKLPGSRAGSVPLVPESKDSAQTGGYWNKLSQEMAKSISRQERNVPTAAVDPKLTFKVVYPNPKAYIGKRVVWKGQFSSMRGNRFVYIGNGPTVATASDFKFFVVDFPDGSDTAVGDGKVTGTVVGTVRIPITISSPSGATITTNIDAPLLRSPEFNAN